jgi:hypothetical protein
MKSKKIYYSLLVFIAFAIGSCESVLDVKPEFAKEGSQIYTNLADYQFALTGGYNLLLATGYFGSGGQTTSTWGNLPDMMGEDLVRTSEDLSNWIRQVNWDYTADEADVQIAWTAAYSVLTQANLVLRNIDQFAAANAQEVNKIKGQALALRGMVHFDLLRYWGESYDRTSTALGIPYIEAVNVDLKPTRLTVQQSWDKILADLIKAETLLGDIGATPLNTATSRAVIDQTVVRALLARVYLYTKDYAQAENYAGLVITARPLATSAQFPTIWTDASVNEVVWSVAFNLGEGVPSAGIHVAGNNRNRFKPSAALEATYDQANDVRFTSYFASRTLSGNSRRIVSKFYARNSAPPASGDNLVNWKAIRSGEMYLIRAEARALQAGKESLAMDDLNALRTARILNYITPTPLTGTALLDAIYLERRKELFAEGHRWFDLKRTTRTINRIAGDAPLASTPLSLAASSRAWNWPIPTVEINSNPNIASQQTTGY